MSERSVMLAHYATGILILLVGALHFLARLSGSFGETISYEAVLSNYRNLFYAASLEALLILVAFHGFNGLRVILLEWKQGGVWEKLVNLVLTLLGLVVVAFGTRTILVAAGVL